MKVWRTAGKAAKNRAFDLPNIFPLTRDQSAARSVVCTIAWVVLFRRVITGR
jgi:hypothetical protein